MRVVLTIKESSHGLWCICSGNAVRLHDRLRFAQAIRLAHELARRENASFGCAVRVEMVCPEFTIVLMQYAGPDTSRRVAA